MRQKIINIIKTNRLIYELFYYGVSLIIRLLSLIIKTDQNLFLFVSFGGKKYDDSPKAIYEYLSREYKDAKFKYIWAFVEPDKYDLPNASKVKIDTFKYIVVALRAKYWITNSAIERGLKFKPRNTILLNTWHGTPIKKICGEGHNVKNKLGFGSKKGSKIDLMTAQSNYDAEIFERLFNVNRDNILICDLPRNDNLSNYTDNECLMIKSKLGIKDLNKKVILYAPTYREFSLDTEKNCVLSLPINLDKWREILEEEYIVLLRAHYEVVELLNIRTDDNFIINATSYPELNDLMKVSDLLISDYSSIFFDYSILERPMLCYAYDQQEYEQQRGIYLNINELFKGNLLKTENELLKRILSLRYHDECEKTRIIKKKFIPCTGNATAIAISVMLEKQTNGGK